MEYFDICDENGRPTGEIISREEAHQKGLLHRTAHVWVVRQKEGKVEILLQKRSDEKDSFPGLYDTSSAGHIPAGTEPLPSAIRELNEELGLKADPEDLTMAGTFRIRYEQEFHGSMFRDNEFTTVYVYQKPVEIQDLTLQESEVSEVRWFDLEEVRDEIAVRQDRFCVPKEGLNVLEDYLNDLHVRKNQELFLKQKALLDQFLETGAISQAQHDKSLHDLTEKMNIDTV